MGDFLLDNIENLNCNPNFTRRNLKALPFRKKARYNLLIQALIWTTSGGDKMTTGEKNQCAAPQK